MRTRMRILAASLAMAATLVLAPAAQAVKTCEPVRNPYPGTRYDGVDLKRIRAVDVSCSRARKVARRAHHKALGLPLPMDGVLRFHWRGWSVTGDLRPDNDRYVARKGGRRVRWRF